MDIKRYIKYIIPAIFGVGLAIAVAACTEGRERLNTPENLQIDGRTLKWDEVENASGYIVSIDGEERIINENSLLMLDLKGPHTYQIEVAAYGEGKYDSSTCSVTELTLQTPVQEGFDEAGFLYTLLEDGTSYELYRGKANTEGEVHMPDFFNGYPVTRIAYSAFSNAEFGFHYPIDPYSGMNCNQITTGLRFPAYIKEIGKSAFNGCVKIEEIVIPDSVTKIEPLAFNGCIGLKRLTLPKGLKEIPHDCFRTNSLEELVLPEGLEKIDADAFSIAPFFAKPIIYEAKPEFTSVVIPETVKEIGHQAFFGCSKLKDITLSYKNLENVENEAFYETAWYDAQPDGMLILKDIIVGYKGEIAEGTVIEIPSYVKRIARAGFNVWGLQSDDDQCNIAEVFIPDGVKFIGDVAFGDCSSLKKVRLPSDLEVLPKNTFGSCSSLTQIVLPATLKIIDSPFGRKKDSGLTEIYYEGTEREWNEILITVDDVVSAATKYFYSESEPPLNDDGTAYNGNYWRYVDGNPVVWTKDKT